MSAFRTTSLAAVPVRGNWQPLRRELGVRAFGVNAWTGDEPGAQVIPEHDETPTRHEELYLVLEGRATFTVAGEEVDAPAGTIVFVADPDATRAAVAAEPGTRVLTVGAPAGAAYEPQTWELNAEVFPLFDRGEYGRAKELLERGLAEHGEHGGLLYNLACAEARLGEAEPALAHLARALELDERLAEHARTDDDLASLRDEPRFPAPASA